MSSPSAAGPRGGARPATSPTATLATCSQKPPDLRFSGPARARDLCYHLLEASQLTAVKGQQRQEPSKAMELPSSRVAVPTKRISNSSGSVSVRRGLDAEPSAPVLAVADSLPPSKTRTFFGRAART